MSFLDNSKLEWWQALAMVLVIGMLPLFRALAVILLAKFVKPDIAKLALPLIFRRKTERPAGRVRPPSETGGR
jgi:ABC-type nickel/cobalt efflux system permease component RcnA